MALTKQERDALPNEDFAVPETRDLPMQDEKHVRMGWDMVDRTKGLTQSQRTRARHRLLERAKKLGMDTTGWSTLKAARIEAMALDMPDCPDHPNRMPFSGVLVKLDQPSDKAPEGSGGRKIIMTRAAAEKAVPSLIGMAVDYTPGFDGHDTAKKIGLITAAIVNGNEIEIEGFIYASDFPDAAARIRADKKVLGFSFEAQNIKLADPGADPLVVTECVFTGAAILRKDKAAYATTALAARAAETREIDMTPEELQAAITAAMGTAIKPLTDRLDKIEAAEKDPAKIKAANMLPMVESHAKALENAADGMTAAGIGGHETRGHAVMARRMAAHLRAAAALGELPHIYRDHDFFASAEKGETKIEDVVKAAVDAAVKPLNDEIKAAGTKIEDLKSKAFNAAATPERKTISAEVKELLAKGNLTKDAEDGKLTVAQVDAMLDAQKLDGTARIEAKLKLQAAGVLKAAA